MEVLENCIRTDLNENAPRAMAVLNSLRVVIENCSDDRVEQLLVANYLQKSGWGTPGVAFLQGSLYRARRLCRSTTAKVQAADSRR